MSEMVERVARAIYIAEMGNLNRYDDVMMSEGAREMARAAIEAMRVPTQKMLCAAWMVDHEAYPGEEWGAMIDAALKE